MDLTDSASGDERTNYQRRRDDGKRKIVSRCRLTQHRAPAPSIRRLESKARLPACSSLRPVHVLLPLRTAEKPAVLSGVYRVLTSSTPRVGGGRGCGKEWGGAACSVWRAQRPGTMLQVQRDNTGESRKLRMNDGNNFDILGNEY